MTDPLYRIKELEWELTDQGCLYAEGVNDFAYLVDVREGKFQLRINDLSAEVKECSDIQEAKAAANEHHRKEVEKMLSPVESGWISVEEALPEDNQAVDIWSDGERIVDMIYLESGLEGSGFYSFDHSLFFWPDPVTHWQPLPPAPGGEI